MIVPRYFCPTHFNCVDYDISVLQKGFSGSKTGPYIYDIVLSCQWANCLCNMWIGLETSRTES